MNLTSDTLTATHLRRTIRMAAAGQAANLENAFAGIGNDTILGNALGNLLRGGAGNDRITGNAGNDQLEGGTGNDIYVFANAAVAEADTILELGGQGIDTLDFSAITTNVTVDLQSDANTASHLRRTVAMVGAGQVANLENVFGGSANDSITGNAANNVLVGNAGVDTLRGNSGDDQLNGGEGNDTLIGGTGSDRYVFANATVAQTDTITELTNEGSDWLDFSAVTTVLTVDLTKQLTTGVHANRTVRMALAGQEANLENVVGGSNANLIRGNAADNILLGGAANDILIGNAGNDTLEGRNGRDVIIGGVGADVQRGGLQDDLLIAGTTNFDANNAALQNIMDEWARTDATYSERIDHLKGTTAGGLNGATLITNATVADDTDVDTLEGQEDLDWFWAQLTDNLDRDLGNGEQLN